MLIYLDLIIVLNFLVDFLLLLAANRLTGFPPGYAQAAWAALLGAGYAGFCVLPGLRFMGNWLWRSVTLFLMAGLAFGWNRSALQRMAVFVILSMALGGIAADSGKTFAALGMCAGILLILCRIGFRTDPGGRRYVPAELYWGGRRLRLLALHDTGNTLRDPVTGESVLVCGGDVAQELLGLTPGQLRDPAAVLASGHFPGMRLVPYRSVGQPSGMMLAVRFREATIGGKKMDPLIAFAPEELAKGEGYRMLTGGALL